LKVDFQTKIKSGLENFSNQFITSIKPKLGMSKAPQYYITELTNIMENLFYELIELIETYNYRECFGEGEDKYYFYNLINDFFVNEDKIIPLPDFLTNYNASIVFFVNDNIMTYLENIQNKINVIPSGLETIDETNYVNYFTAYLLHPFDKTTNIKYIYDISENIKTIIQKIRDSLRVRLEISS
jgi:hypothetical protein